MIYLLECTARNDGRTTEIVCALAIHLRNYVREQKSQHCCRIILATLAVQGLLSKYMHVIKRLY